MNIEEKLQLRRFVPRDYQLKIAKAIEVDKFKRVILCWPRRAGKDIFMWNLMIRAALRKVGVYFYIFPTYAQAKKVIWQSLSNDGIRFLDWIPSTLIESSNSQDMSIRLTNGSLIQLIGSDNIDSIVGTNPIGVCYSEAALQDPRAYQFIRPILAANDGFAWFVSTPRGKNWFYELFEIAKHSSDWYHSRLTLDDTEHIPLREIERERAEGVMSEDLIQQEYYCFPADQLILTPNGIKPIIEIKEDDLVISHKGRNRKVLATISRDYIGDLMEIKSYGSSDIIRCTPNHPIRTYNQSLQTYEWKAAESLTFDDRLVFPKFNLGEISVISYELCMLLAWYISDGSSFMNGLQFTVNTYKSIRVQELLNALKITYSIQENDESPVHNIIINSVQLVDFFKIHCGVMAHDKRIPFSLISSFEDDFFHELMKGDGCFNEHKGHYRFSFTTISIHLAYQVQLLAHSLKRRYSAGITKRYGKLIEFPHGKTYMTQDSYSIQIHLSAARERDSWLMRAKNCVAAKIKSIDKVPYQGKVYNFSVQYDESYLVSGRSVHNCSWDMGVEGAYYSRYMDRMRVQSRIGDCPWVTEHKVHTAWDLGMRDSTTIIFFQTIGQTLRLIDSYENSGHGLEHYLKILQQKPYVYGKHIAPHDIKVRELGTGMSRLEKARQMGLLFTVAPDLSIEDGIESVRAAFSKMWIDEVKCAPLIKALENYRHEYDEKKKAYKANALHNWASHFADCARYMAISLPKTKDGASAEDIERNYREAMGGSQSQLPAVFRDDLPNF